MGIRFDRVSPLDPSDPRVVPAWLDFTFETIAEATYIRWNISQTIPMNAPTTQQAYPAVVEALISPNDARAIAEMLLTAANGAEDFRNSGAGQPSNGQATLPPRKT